MECCCFHNFSDAFRNAHDTRQALREVANCPYLLYEDTMRLYDSPHKHIFLSIHSSACIVYPPTNSGKIKYTLSVAGRQVTAVKSSRTLAWQSVDVPGWTEVFFFLLRRNVVSRANGKNINMTEGHSSCRQIKTATMKLPSLGRMRNPTEVRVFLARSRHRKKKKKKRPSEGKTTVLRYPFISYLWLKHTSLSRFFTSPEGSASPSKSELAVRQQKWRGWQKIKIAHKGERSPARLRATDEREGAACEVYLNYPPLKSPGHSSSHKSPAQELKKSAKEITNSKRHAALNVRRLPPRAAGVPRNNNFALTHRRPEKR